MPDIQLSPAVHQFCHDVLAWIGFGTVVGLLAKALMPGRDPGGAIATLAMGIGGALIGCSLLMYISNGSRVSPLSPVGFLVATAGAFVLLFFYRLLAGRYLREPVDGVAIRAPYFRRRTGRLERIIEE